MTSQSSIPTSASGASVSTVQVVMAFACGHNLYRKGQILQPQPGVAAIWLKRGLVREVQEEVIQCAVIEEHSEKAVRRERKRAANRAV